MMQVTIFSFCMAVLWSSIIVLIQYYVIKKRYFVQLFGIANVLFLYIFSAIRMLMPVEFSFTRVVENMSLWNHLYTYLCIDKIDFMGGTYSRVNILLEIWLAGAAILSVRFIAKYIRALSRINCIEAVHNRQIEVALKKVMDVREKKIKVRVLTSPGIECPTGIGVWKKTILLPDQIYSEDELFYILLHEVTHFQNKDIPLKLLIQFFCCIFWWNPIVYLLRKDLEQILEIRCDLFVVRNMDKKEKISYLSTILHMIKHKGDGLRQYDLGAVSIVGGNSNTDLIERFQIVSDDKRSGKPIHVRLLWYIAGIFLIMTSYLFVLQPSFPTPEEEIITQDRVLDITSQNSFIRQQSDGTYVLVNEMGQEYEIDKDLVEDMLTQGFKVRKGD